MRVTGLRHCACCAASLMMLVPGSIDAQRGHRVSGSRIQVDSRTHWQAWEGATGVLSITPEGTVRPVFVRKNVNASLDAQSFSLAGDGGVVALSNESSATNLSTYPPPQVSMRNDSTHWFLRSRAE